MSDDSKLVIPSDPEKLVDVDAFAEAWMEGLPFTDDQRADIAISISEAVNNAIEHGNAGDSSKSVTVELHELDDGMKIEVTDQGEGFNPGAVKDPTQPENLLDDHGRGLLIIRHLMDEVKLHPGPAGTKVELIKRFNSQNDVNSPS